MRDYAKADGAFQNSGGIRGQLYKGPVKLRDVYQVMPFENTLVELTMTGEQIEKLIKDNLRGERTSMQISGFAVKYKVKDNRVSEVIVEKDGKQINKNDKFKIVTNNYLTNGGSGGKAFMLSSDINDTMISIRDIIIKYIETNKQIKSPGTGRFIKID
jgi:2',3'-cyclic-nucleotide 2'-phosphodiesterase (5'-nucleotidase family)